jgi:oligopeptide transport system ATP-binding protein
VMDLLQELRDTLNLAVILVSHDLNLVTERCDRTNVVYGGLVMESGSSEPLFHHPRHPYTSALIKCTPPLDRDKSVFEPIPGDVIDLAHPPTGCPFHPRCLRKSMTCENVTPELEEIEGDRLVRCHYPLE